MKSSFLYSETNLRLLFATAFLTDAPARVEFDAIVEFEAAAVPMADGGVLVLFMLTQCLVQGLARAFQEVTGSSFLVEVQTKSIPRSGTVAMVHQAPLK